ncbi:MAG: sugar phosphate isomerase/epimerase [Clostridia bacterium]|nr:sugar phosphate isomerase/epimerase [Clostridia bacterium]
MKISTANNLFDCLGELDERYRLAAEMGYTAVDLGMNEWSVGQIFRDETHGFFDRDIDDLIAYYRTYRDAAARHGIEIYQMHAPFPSARIGKHEMNAYIQTVFQKCIQITGAIGCKYLVVHPICSDAYTTEEQDMEADFGLFCPFVDSLKKYGVVMCLENAYHYYNGRIRSISASNADYLVRLAEKLNDLAGVECFGICYDSGHANITGKDHYKEILAYGQHLKVLHLHDTDGVHDTHLIPYTGRYLDRQATDWEGILKAFAKIEYDGTINFECDSGVLAFPVEARGDALRVTASIGKCFVKKIEAYREK